MSCCPKPRSGPEFDPDFEGPSEADMERFGCELVACSECGEEVYDEAEWCPKCGAAMTHSGVEGGSSKPKPWVLFGAGVALGAFVLLILF